MDWLHALRCAGSGWSGASLATLPLACPAPALPTFTPPATLTLTLTLTQTLHRQFLNAHKPWAFVSYVGLYAAHWAFFGLALAAFRGRDALADRAAARRAAKATRPSRRRKAD